MTLSDLGGHFSCWNQFESNVSETVAWIHLSTNVRSVILAVLIELKYSSRSLTRSLAVWHWLKLKSQEQCKTEIWSPQTHE